MSPGSKLVKIAAIPPAPSRTGSDFDISTHLAIMWASVVLPKPAAVKQHVSSRLWRRLAASKILIGLDSFLADKPQAARPKRHV